MPPSSRDPERFRKQMDGLRALTIPTLDRTSELFFYDIAHDMRMDGTAATPVYSSLILDGSTMSAHHRSVTIGYLKSLDTKHDRSYLNENYLPEPFSPHTATLLLPMQQDQGTPFTQAKGDNPSKKPKPILRHSPSPDKYNTDIMFGELCHYLETARINPSRVQLYQPKSTDNNTSRHFSLIAISVPSRDLHILENIQDQIRKNIKTHSLHPDVHKMSSEIHSKSPGNLLAPIPQEIISDLDPGHGRTYYHYLITPESHNTLETKGVLSTLQNYHECFVEGHPDRAAEKALQPDAKSITLLLRVNPEKPVARPRNAPPKNEASSSAPRANPDAAFTMEYGKPLVEWLKSSGAV